MCDMRPIIITFWDPGLCKAQLAPNVTFTPSPLLAPGPSLPVSPVSITRPAITNFGTLGSAEPSFFQQPNFMCCVHATRNASPYFPYLTCKFRSHYGWYVLVYASSVLFWLPPFPVVPPRLSHHYRTCFYGVACQPHAVSLYERMAHCSPNDIVGCAPLCGEGIHKIPCGSTCQHAFPHYVDLIRKVLALKQLPRWVTNFSKEAYYVWLGMCHLALPQAAVPSGESTIAVMWADSRKLVHAGLTKPSRLSIADQGALQFLKKSWRSIVRRDIVVWADN